MTGVGGELLLGVVLGLSLAGPPGPMNAWIAAAASRSYRSGVATGLGAVSADAILAAVVFLLSRTFDLEAGLRFVCLLGAAVMGFFSWRLASALRRPVRETAELRSFGQALGLGLSNPFQILWWLTGGVGFAYVGGAALLLGLFGALVGWVLAFPLAVRAGARRSPKVERGILVVSAAAMAGFAGYFLVLALIA